MRQGTPRKYLETPQTAFLLAQACCYTIEDATCIDDVS